MALLSAVCLMGLPVLSMSGQTNTVAAATSLSIFTQPTISKEGRDPFFPNSTRPYQAAVVPSTRATEVDFDSLVLQGISGVAPNRLAVINKRTLGVGDYAEVSTSKGRIHIHCLEINANSALIEVNGQRHELRYEEKQ